MLRSIITLFIAFAAIFLILPSATDATPLPITMAKRSTTSVTTGNNGGHTLTARDFNCNVENVQCCQQLLSKNEATKSLGGLLNLPVNVIGNVGLSCTVSLNIYSLSALSSQVLFSYLANVLVLSLSLSDTDDTFTASSHFCPISVQVYSGLLLTGHSERRW